jgi:DNA-binding transcriptional MerR regulator
MEIEFENRKHWVIRGDAFDFRFGDYFGTQDGKNISARLNEKIGTLQEGAASYRVISHWENEGLINDDRPTGTGWRKYSLMDRVWIGIIAELRKFGFPIEKIKKVKDDLSMKGYKFNCEFPILEIYVALALQKQRAFLLVFENGEAQPVTPNELAFNNDLGTISNYLSIGLNQILQSALPEKDLQPEFSRTFTLAEEELDLIQLLRSTNCKEIKVTRRDGHIERIDAKEDRDVKERIVDLLKVHDYQDIQITTANGKIVSLSRTIKQRPRAEHGKRRRATQPQN